jgi:D-alanine--poly(phosphoribitol) ligase subunit 2
MTNQESILQILAQVTETPDVLTDPNLPLFDMQILDSMQVVNLIVRLGQDLDVHISPAEFDRAAWATPKHFVEDVLGRLPS